jgi:hypothetical protein
MKAASRMALAFAAGIAAWPCVISLYTALFVRPCPPGCHCAMGMIGVIVIGGPVACFSSWLVTGALLPRTTWSARIAWICLAGVSLCLLTILWTIRRSLDRVLLTLGAAYVLACAGGLLLGYGVRRWWASRRARREGTEPARSQGGIG